MTAEATPEPVRAFIDKTVADNPVVLFMKGSPDMLTRLYGSKINDSREGLPGQS